MMVRYANKFRLVLFVGIVFVSIVPIQTLLGLNSLIGPLTETVVAGGYVAFLLLFSIALIEALFVISLYFPGTIVLIGVMVAFTNKSPADLVVASLAVGLGAIAGSLLNYFATYYYYTHVKRLGHKSILDLSQRLFTKFGKYTSVLLSAHPNYLGALYTLFGVLRIGLGLTPLLNVLTVTGFVLGYFHAIRWVGLSVSEDSINALYIGLAFVTLYVALVAVFSVRDYLRAPGS